VIKLSSPPQLVIDPEWLRTEYIQKKVSMRSIAHGLGVSTCVVHNVLSLNKIPIRHHAGGARLGQKTKSIMDYTLLHKEFVEERKSAVLIALEVGTTVDHVNYSLKHHGIRLKHRLLDRFNGRFEDLPPEPQQLLLGTLLGDACISQSKVNSYHLRLGQKQLEYVRWKVSLLPEFFSDAIQISTTKLKTTQKVYTRYCATSYVHPVFAELRQIFYPSGIKVIARKMLERLDAFGLAVWVMDNGSGNRTWPGRIDLATNGYTLAEQKILQCWFVNRWNIRPAINFSKGTYRLRFGVADSRKLADIIRQYILPFFLYKIHVWKPKLTSKSSC